MVARREQLAISQSRAAKLANVSRTTWVNWEQGNSAPERFNYTKIERPLKWEPGSVQAVLDGHEPQPVRDEHSPPALPIDPAVLSRYNPADRAAVIAVLRAAERNAAAIQNPDHSFEGTKRRSA